MVPWQYLSHVCQQWCMISLSTITMFISTTTPACVIHCLIQFMLTAHKIAASSFHIMPWLANSFHIFQHRLPWFTPNYLALTPHGNQQVQTLLVAFQQNYTRHNYSVAFSLHNICRFSLTPEYITNLHNTLHHYHFSLLRGGHYLCRYAFCLVASHKCALNSTTLSHLLPQKWTALTSLDNGLPHYNT